jgi:hypothetical protein
VEVEFCELRRDGVLRSSAIIQNQGVGKGPSGLRPFCVFSLACIFECVSAHGTTESGGL